MSDSRHTFRWLWMGQLISNFGTQCSLYGVGLWMFSRHGRLADFALVALVVQLARILVVPLLGARLGRWSPRRVMLVANALGALCTLAMAALLLGSGSSDLLLPVLIVQAAAAMTEAALVLCFSTLIPMLMGQGEALARANGLFATADGLVVTVAPFLGAWLGGLAGLPGVLVLDGLSFIAALACLQLAPWPPRLRLPLRPVAAGLQAAAPWTVLRQRWQQQRLRGPLLLGMAVALVYAAVEVLFPAWVVAAFGAPQMGLVLLLGGLGYGTGLTLWHWSPPSVRWRWFAVAPVVQSLILMGAGLQVFQAMTMLWSAAVWVFTAMLPLVLAGLQTLWCHSAETDDLHQVFALRYSSEWSVRLLAFGLAAVAVDQWLRPALHWPGWPGWIPELLGLGPGRSMAVAMGAMGWVLMLTWLSQRRSLAALGAGR